jgi:hypothetical protein
MNNNTHDTQIIPLKVLQEKLDDIRIIYERIYCMPLDFPRLSKRQEFMYQRFFHEIDSCIDRLEDLYYRYVLRNKKIDKLKSKAKDDGQYVSLYDHGKLNPRKSLILSRFCDNR